MSAVSRHPIALLMGVLVLILSIIATELRAQEPPLDLPTNLSDSGFQAMLGRLSDEQVRNVGEHIKP